jgi:integrase/recombinase XerD
MNSAARIEAFLEMMSAERGAAENTLSSYRRDLEDASEQIKGGLAGAGTADLRAYLNDIAARGFATTSQARKLSAIRQFFKFLYAEGLRGDDPTGTLDSPRKDRPLPKTMSEADTGRLLTARHWKRPTRRKATAIRWRRFACMPLSRCSTPPACASPNWSACR